jgi:hypothetical protein
LLTGTSKKPFVRQSVQTALGAHSARCLMRTGGLFHFWNFSFRQSFHTTSGAHSGRYLMRTGGLFHFWNFSFSSEIPHHLWGPFSPLCNEYRGAVSLLEFIFSSEFPHHLWGPPRLVSSTYWRSFLLSTLFPPRRGCSTCGTNRHFRLPTRC